MRMVLLGPPGSGKGTQGSALSAVYGVPLISSGDLLRDEVARDTPLGRQVKECLDRGELVPDDVVLAVIVEACRVALQAGGYILDGFPRTRRQAERANELAAPVGAEATGAVLLDVPDDVARERLAGRAGEGRLDDRDPEVIEQRLRVYHEESRPLIEYYTRRGILVRVDGTKPVSEITASVLDALGAR